MTLTIIVQSLLCRKCFPWRGQPKGKMGKAQFSHSLSNEILIGVCDEISLNMSYYFDMLVASEWGNRYTQLKKIMAYSLIHTYDT